MAELFICMYANLFWDGHVLTNG